jgi:hypothetical protein
LQGFQASDIHLQGVQTNASSVSIEFIGPFVDISTYDLSVLKQIENLSSQKHLLILFVFFFLFLLLIIGFRFFSRKKRKKNTRSMI